MICRFIAPVALLGASAFVVPHFFHSSETAAEANTTNSPAGAVALDSNTYEIDGVHSAVNFRVKHMGVSYNYGRFNKFKGSLVFDEKAPEKSSITAEVDADSIDTNSEGRDKHLKGGDFFNVKQFPNITFKSTAVKKVDDKHFDVTGDFTMHGVTKPVTVRAEFVGSGKDPRVGTRVGFDLLFQVKRSDFDMKYMLEGLGDEVTIHAGVEAVQVKEKK